MQDAAEGRKNFANDKQGMTLSRLFFMERAENVGNVEKPRCYHTPNARAGDQVAAARHYRDPLYRRADVLPNELGVSGNRVDFVHRSAQTWEL